MTERTCSEDGCDRPHFGRGMCSRHYNRWAYQRRKDTARYAAFKAELEAAKADRLTRTAKPCSKCGETKPFAEFSTTPRTSDGRHSWCKSCCRDLARASYDPEKARERHSLKQDDPAYRAMKKLAYDRWRAEHPERMKAACLRWRAENPERVREASRRWAAENADRVRISKRVTRQNRRAVMAATSVGPVRLLEILDRDGMVCHLCRIGIESADDLHFDHVVPLSRGGTHTMDNIKPAHAACNLRKHDKLMSELDWVVAA